jgi:hypothetical protein
MSLLQSNTLLSKLLSQNNLLIEDTSAESTTTEMIKKFGKVVCETNHCKSTLPMMSVERSLLPS